MNFYEDNGPKAPCTRDCPNRSADPNCHAVCEKYLKYLDDYQAYKDRIRSSRGFEMDLDRYEKKRRMRKK